MTSVSTPVTVKSNLTSRQITIAILQTALDENGEVILSGTDLSNTAAASAAKVLIENWATALNDGDKLENLLGDVDDTICVLQEWRDSFSRFKNLEIIKKQQSNV